MAECLDMTECLDMADAPLEGERSVTEASPPPALEAARNIADPPSALEADRSMADPPPPLETVRTVAEAPPLEAVRSSALFEFLSSFAWNGSNGLDGPECCEAILFISTERLISRE